MPILLVATHNPAKFDELKKGLKPLEKSGVKIVSLKDVGIKDEPDEPGDTFEENAIIKAKFYASLTNLPTVADDGGLGIDILNGEPGVISKMWLGREASDEELIQHTLARLKGVPKEKRTGYFETCVCYYNQETKTTLFDKERILGHFSDKVSSRRIKGYPFRSLFIIDSLNKYYDELTEEEHESINHRLKALSRLVTHIKADLLQ